MSDYIKQADYAAKDSLPTGDLNKVIRGTELGAEFDAIAVAIATKYDAADLNVTLQQYNADTVVFASGTAMLFKQTTAPTGWTKDTTNNDAALRVVSGTASTGGTDAYTAVFGTGKSTASYTLTTTDIPSHNHSATDSGHTHSDSTFVFGSGNAVRGDGASYYINSSTTTTGTGYASITVGSTGGGGGHSHGLNNLNLKYVDVIVATKD
jgi:microcystin-dependent protein